MFESETMMSLNEQTRKLLFEKFSQMDGNCVKKEVKREDDNEN